MNDIGPELGARKTPISNAQMSSSTHTNQIVHVILKFIDEKKITQHISAFSFTCLVLYLVDEFHKIILFSSVAFCVCFFGT